MTREEQIDWLCRLRADLNNGIIFTPWNKEFTEALTGILKQESCEDVISRQAAIDMIQMRMGGKELYKAVYELPSVTPQEPKTGHWIDIMVGDMPAQACDQCNTFYPLAYTGGGHNYCPNCGSQMSEIPTGSEPQESEE